MYGIINQAIQEMIVQNYGEETWQQVLEKSNTDVDFFLSNEFYEDDVTYKLATAISETVNLSVADVLFSFGEYWVLNIGEKKYGSLMFAGGSDFREFLINLPVFHNRIMLIYPSLQPPEFQVANILDNSLHVHYYSKRKSLTSFVNGLLNGLAKLYKVNATIELLYSNHSELTHDEFIVSW